MANYKISKPYNGYATLTVMRKSGDVELIAKIKILTLKDIKKKEVINTWQIEII